MNSYNSFTTLERSLASFGADVRVTDGAVGGGKKKRNNKKRTQKSKPTVDNTISHEPPANDHPEGTEEGWMPVVSKKVKSNVPPKVTDSSAIPVEPVSISTMNPQLAVLDIPVTSQHESRDSTAPKKKNRKSGKFAILTIC